MGNRQNGDARLALVRVEQSIDVERRPVEPCLESRRHEQRVEPHGEREALRRRHERVDIRNADALEARRLQRPDQCAEVESASRPPFVVENGREQHVLATRHGVGVDADERQQAGRGGAERLGGQIRVLEHGRAGRVERGQRRQRPPGGAARRIEACIRRRPQFRDALRGLTPVRESLPPRCCHIRRVIRSRCP
jgi:hypothetical protein